MSVIFKMVNCKYKMKYQQKSQGDYFFGGDILYVAVAMSCRGLIVAMAAEAASAAQSMTVEFKAGDAISEEVDSCTMSR